MISIQCYHLVSKFLCSGFVDKTLSWGFWKLFPTGTYAIIGTTCVEFENVMKSTTKKKYFISMIKGIKSTDLAHSLKDEQ